MVRNSVSAMALTVALFVSSAPVLAQDGKGAADNSTDEILVTAQFRQQNV